ncbi:serine/threonine-protein phosphatase 4 regulatory subunit 1-like isoform X2 [Rhinatrema bivittatum]|uniref:serine/threonine-protein phosphatase 4 regulatory subunit 1-like isoform X2 n=1 Tax=Rhinatrema bivittatum TaxID=194408 RepID=UPI00112D042A|nr:serine/threonine-protein phosphatase 4 regulatory subunit 1-like isoform X2 [Rhinatrema bivittatum]
MAGDIPLYFVDLQDDLDDFGFEDYEPDCETMRITAFLDIPGQDNLTPLARLEKYAFSDNIFNRQIIARGLLDVLRDFSSNEEDFLTVMEIVVRLAEDAEPTVRTELMEQVPPIAIFLQESRPNFPSAFSEYLLPIVVRYLTDPNNQVRKASQEALLILLEQDLIELSDIENKVCPVLLDLSATDSDDEYKVEAVNIICKMTSMLGRDTVEQMLLPRFCELCSDGKLFQVRKVCAANFGDICNAVGQEATEKFLIPKFLELCTDSVWGMRKACAECFMAVSYTASGEIRRTKLSPLFINLISDPCRWVRQAAFQSLGPFISTFANPSSAGLYIREDGTLSIRPPAEDLHFSSCSLNPTNLLSARSGKPTEMELGQPWKVMSSETNNLIRSGNSSHDGVHTVCSASITDGQSHLSPSVCTVSAVLKDPGECPGGGRCEGLRSEAQAGNVEDVFNSFLFWRSPLPDISQDLELLQSKCREDEDSNTDQRFMAVCNSYTASSEIKKVLESLQEHIDDPDVEAQIQVLTAALRAAHLDSMSEEKAKINEECSDTCQQEISHPESSADHDNKDTSTSLLTHKEQTLIPSTISLQSICSPAELTRANEHLQEQGTDFTLEEKKSKLQDIIPQPLLDQYLSMTDPARAQTVDTEIAKHCAYSLPGVALTLGRQNWHCLRDTYEMLASDEQWKVRRTLAFSIHELAVILGDKLTAADLVPIFNGFLKDLDEVRIGVLKHLYDFLKLLQADKRREYLYQLQEFMVTDNSRNWRFRYELAEQLILILELYSPSDVYDYLRYIALTLCSDKVSEVRWISFKLVVAILHKFYENYESELGINFINELIVRFRHSSKWVGRQAFAFICQVVIEEECMPVDQFVMHLLPSLLSLASDPVPNVRVLLAKALRRTLLEKAYFVSVGNPHVEVVEETVLALQSDRDQDVRFFATAEAKQNNTETTTLQEES